jgi:predicted MPP superfamily phosphohydrolase
LKHRAFIIFFSIVFSVYGLVNYYIFITGWNAFPHTSLVNWLYITIYLILSLSFIAGRFLERAILNWFSSLIVWIGSFWLGAMVYFLLFAVFFDLIRLINLFIPVYPDFVTRNYEQAKYIIFLCVIGIVLVIVFAGYINARTPRIKKLKLTLKKASASKQLKLAVASDIHLGTIICKSRVEKMVSLINTLNADIVLLPGDVVDEDLGPVIKQNLGETLRKIKSKYGVFGITGNHEYIGGAEPACKYLEEHGITMLRDNYVEVNDEIYIVGREDRSIKQFSGKLRKPLEDIMGGIDKSKPILLMDHQPVKLAEAEKNGVDLQLSGHTHHGQLWPFNFITKKVYELSWGYKLNGSTHYYVSCGAGTWGPPVRTGNKPEILFVGLEFRT